MILRAQSDTLTQLVQWPVCWIRVLWMCFTLHSWHMKSKLPWWGKQCSFTSGAFQSPDYQQHREGQKEVDQDWEGAGSATNNFSRGGLSLSRMEQPKTSASCPGTGVCIQHNCQICFPPFALPSPSQNVSSHAPPDPVLAHGGKGWKISVRSPPCTDLTLSGPV